MSQTKDNLRAPAVDEAPDGVLDPQTLPPGGATVRIKPWTSMMYRDHVYLFVGDTYTDDLPISAGAVNKDVLFNVDAREFVADENDIVPIRYEVQFYQSDREPSDALDLKLQAAFEAAATLDLSSENYVSSVDKPPPVPPPAARMTREANWGSAPFTYESTDRKIASVDARSGEVTALRNGTCWIRATDSQNQSREYPLTIKGIEHVYFLSASADWEGMNRICAAAKLQAITLTQARRLWTLYFPDAGPVAEFLEWLNYPVWTADLLGAGTAWTYDLNGSSVNDNASSQDIASFCQVLGVSRE
ncbi:Ig-like domain-containing protein [Pseudomonas sputi]|uniref:Ig-like domain-containing protein n=1 Tax=Pseudomonas sputi TaxID=2892325 RepID=UPI001F3342F0|nr:Ig-like domain-containing protein [Pseudomonas sputi]